MYSYYINDRLILNNKKSYFNLNLFYFQITDLIIKCLTSIFGSVLIIFLKNKEEYFHKLLKKNIII